MLSRDSIFYYLTDENENACTQLLSNMMKTKYIRDIILRFLCKNGINEDILNSIEDKHIATQTSFSENGRPDIVIQNNKCCIYIENKILTRTGLTDNQPNGYFSELKKQFAELKELIFLLPDGYGHERELDNKIKNLENDAKLNYIVITKRKWSDLCNVLSKAQIDSKSSVFKECLNYIRETVQTQSSESSILTSSETSLLFQSEKIIKIYNFLEKVKHTSFKAIESIKASHSISSEITEQFNCWGIGHTIHIDNMPHIFIGLSPLIDKEHASYAFSICFWYEKPITNEFSYKNLNYKPFTSAIKENNGYWTYYKIDKPLFYDEKQDELNSLVCFIANQVMKNIL